MVLFAQALANSIDSAICLQALGLSADQMQKVKQRLWLGLRTVLGEGLVYKTIQLLGFGFVLRFGHEYSGR